MTSDFDKFTERARKVLVLSSDEAQRFNHAYIGTEHLLLGMVREGTGVAARVLTNMGVQLPKVRSAVEFIIGRGEGRVEGEIGMSPRARNVLALAIGESRQLGHDHIGTEHLLLGLIREGEGIAAGVLESLGVDLEKVRRQVMLVLEQSPGPVPSRPAPPKSADQTADVWDVAMLTIALRLARKREDAKAVASIRAALESSELRRLVGMRVRATDRLVEAEHRRIELMTRIMNLEREIENYDRQIERIRIEHAQLPEEDPPDEAVGAPR